MTPGYRVIMTPGYRKDHKYIEDHGVAAQILERVRHVVVMIQGSAREESEAHITWQYQQETWTLKGARRIDPKNGREIWVWELSLMAHARYTQAVLTKILTGDTDQMVAHIDSKLSVIRLSEEMRVLATKNEGYGDW